MGLADALEQARPGLPKGPKCAVCILLTTLPEADAAALNAALDDESFALSSILRAMDAEGLPRIGGHTWRRHRRRECMRGAV